MGICVLTFSPFLLILHAFQDESGRKVTRLSNIGRYRRRLMDN